MHLLLLIDPDPAQSLDHLSIHEDAGHGKIRAPRLTVAPGSSGELKIRARF